MSKKQIGLSPRVSVRAAFLIDALKTRWGLNQTEVILLALERAWQETNQAQPNARITEHSLDDVKNDGTPPVG